ncbi:glycoside hydrolase family 30 protein [Fusibacter bizertensis]
MKANINMTQFMDHKPVFIKSNERFVPDTQNQENNIINLYPQVTYQRIGEFGGAITEAVGVTLKKMPPAVQEEIIQAYFAPSGLGYNMVRTHLDSCDFSLSNYSAITIPGDDTFKTFSLERDETYIIPYIKMAYTAAKSALPIMISPWSPPAFMKTNGSRNGGGKLKTDYYQEWASYICHYIQQYRSQGLMVSAISIQNEPNASQIWDSCLYSDEEEKLFLKAYLYPELQKHGLDDLEIYIWDHNKERVFDRASKIIDNETNDMIAGVAFHWYSGDHFDALALVREKYPDKKLMFSEGCIEYSLYGENSELQNAQRYAHDMIGNFKSGMHTFIDWNIALDEQGGPNHAGNFCEAPIICDTRTGTYSKKLSFYYIEHFSRYISLGAVRIATTQFTDKIEVVAFKNPDGTLVVILLNRQTELIETYLRMNEKLLNLKIPRESIVTVTISEIV